MNASATEVIALTDALARGRIGRPTWTLALALALRDRRGPPPSLRRLDAALADGRLEPTVLAAVLRARASVLGAAATLASAPPPVPLGPYDLDRAVTLFDELAPAAARGLLVAVPV